MSVYYDTSLLFHHWYIMPILSILVHIQGHGGVSLTHLAITFNGFIVVSFVLIFPTFKSISSSNWKRTVQNTDLILSMNTQD